MKLKYSKVNGLTFVWVKNGAATISTKRNTLVKISPIMR